MSIAGSRRSSGHVRRAQTASRESLVRGARRRWGSGAARRSVGRARGGRAGGEPGVAGKRVEEALGVWRGPPLGGVSTNNLLVAERARLEEERLAAVIDGIDLDLELGRHGELLGQLEAGHRASVQGAPGGVADAGAVSLRAAGRRADGVPSRARTVRRRTRHRARSAIARSARGRAEALRQVSPPAETTLEAEPRPATASALSNRRLPVPPNRTIGREHDIVAVVERLRGSVRLLTLTGPGGVGKTRLSLAAARAVQADFANGAYFVSLAALHRPEDVPAAIISTLGIIVLTGESADQA